MGVGSVDLGGFRPAPLSVMFVVRGRRLSGPAFLAMMMLGAMRHARHHELGVILLAHAGQLLEEGDGRPQLRRRRDRSRPACRSS